MTNLFYALQTFTKNTLARAENVQSFSAAVVSAFDKVPPQLELEHDRVTYGTTAGAADVYTIASTHPITTYTEGFHARVKIHATNTGPSTMNFDAVGAKSVKLPSGADPAAGDLLLDAVLDVTYDGTNLRLHTVLSDVTAAAASAAAALVSEGLADDDRVLTNADVVLTNLDVTYTAEWANKAEDSLVSSAAGGDAVDDYSAKHFANKASASATAAANSAKTAYMIAVTGEAETLTTGLAKITFRMPFALTLTGVRASLNTVSSSGIPTIDINETGSGTILSTKLTIDAGEKTSTTAAAAAVISDTALADDAEITIDIDVAGTGAKGLKVTLIGDPT